MYNIVNPVVATYENVKEMIHSLCTKFPFLRLKTLGESVLNKNIYSIEFGDNKDRVLYAGAFHGQEWMTSLIILRFIEELASSFQMYSTLADVDIRRAMFGRGVVFVPMVNPDGVDLSISGIKAAGKNSSLIFEASNGGDFSSWNANANGVDINHNFDAGFDELRNMERAAGIFGPAPRRYGGPHAESEPETKIIADFCRNGSIRYALCFHSQGEEIYYDYMDKAPKSSHLMAEILAVSSRYSLVNQGGLASHGGCKDFIIDKLHKPAFTVEIGKGKNPLPLSDFNDIYNKICEMMVLSIVL